MWDNCNILRRYLKLAFYYQGCSNVSVSKWTLTTVSEVTILNHIALVPFFSNTSHITSHSFMKNSFAYCINILSCAITFVSKIVNLFCKVCVLNGRLWKQVPHSLSQEAIEVILPFLHSKNSISTLSEIWKIIIII